jgi:hypothetical protein
VLAGAAVFSCLFLLSLFTVVKNPDSGGDWDPLIWPGLAFFGAAALSQVCWHLARGGVSPATAVRALGYALLCVAMSAVASVLFLVIYLVARGATGN